MIFRLPTQRGGCRVKVVPTETVSGDFSDKNRPAVGTSVQKQVGVDVCHK